ILMSKDGERIGALGSGRSPSFGKRAVDRLLDDLARGTKGQFPPPPKASATMVVASDFYDPPSEWQARLGPLAGRCPEGVLLAVSAPVEIAFPFEGRTKLSRPGTGDERILGRAETMREEYMRRFTAQREALSTLAARMGWALVTHVTGSPALSAAARLKAEIERFGVQR